MSSGSSSERTSSSSSCSQEKTCLEISAPWALIRSKISKTDASSIRWRFFIPGEYGIIVPGPKDRIDEPPDRCLAFHVASLEAGLRFPLSRHVEDIVSGLDVCPAQLMPNSYRHILGFIILMLYFQVDPSFVNFWNLIRVASKTGLEGFFYLIPKSCKLLRNLPSSLGRWKNKFVYVKSPENRPWRVPTRWNVARPEPLVLESPSWGQDFISDVLSKTLCETSKILKEEVLTLADLSPAPIKKTRSLEMAVRASIQGKITKSPPVIASDSKGKDSGSNRAQTKNLSEDQVVVPTVHNAEKIVRDMRGDHDGSSSRDGDNIKPSKDTFEKYKYNTLRGVDQSTLVDHHLTKLEDVAAYHSSGIKTVTEQLLLRATCLEDKLQTYKSEANQKLKELEKSLKDSNDKNVELKMCSNQEIEKLKQTDERKRKESFNDGRAVGRKEFKESDEYRSAMNKARDEGLKAFLKSNTCATLVAKRADGYEFKGFSKLEDEMDAEEEDEFAYLLKRPDCGN